MKPGQAAHVKWQMLVWQDCHTAIAVGCLQYDGINQMSKPAKAQYPNRAALQYRRSIEDLPQNTNSLACICNACTPYRIAKAQCVVPLNHSRGHRMLEQQTFSRSSLGWKTLLLPCRLSCACSSQLSCTCAWSAIRWRQTCRRVRAAPQSRPW